MSFVNSSWPTVPVLTKGIDKQNNKQICNAFQSKQTQVSMNKVNSHDNHKKHKKHKNCEKAPKQAILDFSHWQ